MSYGAIAEYLYQRFGRGSARRVGTIMARLRRPGPHGTGWSVGAAGSHPATRLEARRRLESEGVSFRGPRIRMADYSWWPPA